MKKLGLIIRREYLSRVTKRSFILATLLTPLAIILFMVIIGLIFSYQGDDVQSVAIINDAQLELKPADLNQNKNLQLKVVDQSLEELRATFDESGFDGILVIPPIKNLYASSHTLYYYSEKNPTLSIETSIKSIINRRIRDYKIGALQIEERQLEALSTQVDLDPEPISEGGDSGTKITNIVGAGIGGFMGFIMYMAVFIYGMMVMRSVMEEKTSRIVEVMISSVKPFELMMGKIIGVGAVGLTQLSIWALVIPILSLLANLVFGFDMSAANPEASAAMAELESEAEEMQGLILQTINEIQNIPWGMIAPLFLFYFLGGYFLYASLFAAVGSAMGDDYGEGQALTIPITIPVILAFYIMFVTLENPNSSLAIFSSIFPLFSPIVMPARLAFDPPVWQILLSVLVLAGSSIFFIWLSGRIYRVGILLYGKKVTLRELGRWIFSNQ